MARLTTQTAGWEEPFATAEVEVPLLLRIPHDATERQALVHLPQVQSEPAPLVMVLHGAGGNAVWTEEETHWSDLAHKEGFAIVYPEALAPRADRLVKFLTNPPMWNDLSPRGREHPRHPDDVGFIEKVLDRLLEEHSIDPNRIFLTGFSNGAGMTFRLGSELGNRFRAIAPVAGLCRFEPKPTRPVATLYLIGDSDPLIPLDGGLVHTPWRYSEEKPTVWETLAIWSHAMSGFDSTPTETEQDGIRWLEYGPYLRAGIVPGLGHHWPGGKGRFAERYAGRALSHPDATRLIWEFFRDR